MNSVFVQHLVAKNFLSFGPDSTGIDLQSLNVFIGPNGSGKSNLIEVINLMRSAPRDLGAVIRKGGGLRELIWKGQPSQTASVSLTVSKPRGVQPPLDHLINLHPIGQMFTLDESVEDAQISGSGENTTYYRYDEGRAVIRSREGADKIILWLTGIDPASSILAQRRDPESYPELAWLAGNYEKIRIYREWEFGRNSVFREPQRTDMRNDVLEEDFTNLGLFLNMLRTRFPIAKKALLDGLKDLYSGIDDFDIAIGGGTVQVFFTEGDFVIPATRLSDGTLRYLCLLAILCDPNPPPLICIEEPELGLHPDILPKLADLLRSASERTQLIVTTHSDILVDAMTDTPDAVVVCSKQAGQTHMERLNSADLAEWLKEYRLGELWIKGDIGGTRW